MYQSMPLSLVFRSKVTLSTGAETQFEDHLALLLGENSYTPDLCARFREAVEKNRRALDRRWMSRPIMERIQQRKATRRTLRMKNRWVVLVIAIVVSGLIQFGDRFGT